VKSCKAGFLSDCDTEGVRANTAGTRLSRVEAWDHEGERLGEVPKWTANAMPRIHPQCLPDCRSPRLDYSYQSSRSNIVAEQNPAYFVSGHSELTNLHVQLSGGSWSLGLDVDNLFDAFAPVSGKTLDANLIRTVTAAPPRTIGLRISKTFQ
jgi:hypothetical protein